MLIHFLLLNSFSNIPFKVFQHHPLPLIWVGGITMMYNGILNYILKITFLFSCLKKKKIIITAKNKLKWKLTKKIYVICYYWENRDFLEQRAILKPTTAAWVGSQCESTCAIPQRAARYSKWLPFKKLQLLSMKY